jgi:hypothetical protein
MLVQRSDPPVLELPWARANSSGLQIASTQKRSLTSFGNAGNTLVVKASKESSQGCARLLCGGALGVVDGGRAPGAKTSKLCRPPRPPRLQTVYLACAVIFLESLEVLLACRQASPCLGRRRSVRVVGAALLNTMSNEP